jgi:hypothetical protein
MWFPIAVGKSGLRSAPRATVEAALLSKAAPLGLISTALLRAAFSLTVFIAIHATRSLAAHGRPILSIELASAGVPALPRFATTRSKLATIAAEAAAFGAKPFTPLGTHFSTSRSEPTALRTHSTTSRPEATALRTEFAAAPVRSTALGSKPAALASKSSALRAKPAAFLSGSIASMI